MQKKNYISLKDEKKKLLESERNRMMGNGYTYEEMEKYIHDLEIYHTIT